MLNNYTPLEMNQELVEKDRAMIVALVEKLTNAILDLVDKAVSPKVVKKC